MGRSTHTVPDRQAPTSTKTQKMNRPAIRESQVEGTFYGVMQRSAAVGVLWGIWRGLGWGEGGWVVLWRVGRLGGTAAVATGVRNLPVL